MTKINLQPMGTRVLIKPLEPESKTAYGLLLPETANKKPQTGLVVAIGEGDEIKMDGTEYLLLEANDILAKFLSN